MSTNEIVLEVEQKKVFAGFAKRNANKERIEKEEAELEELKAPEADQEPEEAQEPEPKGAEEKTFKKRYGDLRRHAQKTESDLQKQIDELKQQLDASTKKQIKYPKTDEELDQWIADYPDIAKIVETIAMKKTHEHASEYETKFKQIDEMKYEAQKQKAEAELMRIHPDYEDIIDSEEFHNWVDAQPQWVQSALYDNYNDASSAARAIDLYKADTGVGKKDKNASAEKEAAKSVGTRAGKSKPEADETAGYIKESDVLRMSAKDYEKYQEEIAEAVRQEKFIYDVSGSAR